MTTTTAWRLVPAAPDQDWTNAFAARGPRIGTFGATIRDVLDTAPGPVFALADELQAVRAALAFLPDSDAAVSGLDRILGKLSGAPDRKVAATPSASQEQQDGAQKQAVMEAIAEALGGAYDCTRAWSAWGVGTMGRDDFSLVAEDSDRVSELADAAIAAMHRAPAAGDALELKRKTDLIAELSKIIHNMTVAQQAAWIEWRHGAGADAAMQWIENGLYGPGHIPDEDEPYGTEAQAYFDANQADPFPVCHCGRPSNILHMGSGYCSDEHYRAAIAQQSQQSKGDEA